MSDNKNQYKDSLNLPNTAFSMEAKLVQNEPIRLAKWKSMNLYQKLMDARKDAQAWILHDGPPFANGDIHIGHVINKTLKDIVMRFRSMQGFKTPYVPGWDCHGLPIEHKIADELKGKMREMSPVDVRKLCFEYAKKYATLQSEQFQRMGVLGQWDQPYWTMKPEYETQTLEVFAKFVEAGLVYKKLKPVPWSIQNQTALADAELEYQDVEDPSVFVEFPSSDSASLARLFNVDLQNEPISFLVWTTTPWTLPANLAIAVHPEVTYALVKYVRDGKTRYAIAAEDLFKIFTRPNVTDAAILGKTSGNSLVEAGCTYKHPFVSRTGKILPALYVTTTDGTGLVHTAPGHGEDDYITGLNNKLEVYCPVQANGRFDTTAPEFIQGKTVWEANPLVIDCLKNLDVLFDCVKITHSYPHDWRSKKPVIQRATEQWFISVDRDYTANGATNSIRKRALNAIENQVQFIPDWGKARINGMLQSRPDWCISRQRAWGLPIPVFYNEKGDALLTPASVRAVAKRFAEVGSDAWFTETPEQLLAGCDTGPNFPKDKLRKEKDIFDVWFESGSSWKSVLMGRPGFSHPCEMYLEGSDQHRGWFQLSLLASLGATGVAPYKQVLTHGFVVKPDGKKVSKSDKEYVKAVDEINRHGADLLRLWCSSVDYQNDIPTSPQVIKEFGDKYRKIRNTLKYLLSNLYDYNPADAVAIPTSSLDAWAMDQLDTLIAQTLEAYEQYQLHRVFSLLYNFCAVQISAVYGNAMKDRLYCEKANSPLRRRCQTVMHAMDTALTKLLAPILVYTADEAWEHIPNKPQNEANLESVHLALFPKTSGQKITDETRAQWAQLMTLRDSALAQLDAIKKNAGMNKALDAEIVYTVPDEATKAKLAAYAQDLEDLVAAGCHSIVVDPATKEVTVTAIDRRNDYKACARSWKRRPDVGANPAHPELSTRDAMAMG